MWFLKTLKKFAYLILAIGDSNRLFFNKILDYVSITIMHTKPARVGLDLVARR